MRDAVALTLQAYLDGRWDYVAAKAALLAHFTGTMTARQAQLTSDYVGDMLVDLANGSASIEAAIEGLMESILAASDAPDYSLH